MSRIVLASASPRRRELLTALGFRLDVRPADVDESVHPGEAPLTYVRRVALAKAHAVARALRGADGGSKADAPVIVAADTVVVQDGAVLGKPEDFAEFERTMRRLSGAAHEVTTAVVVRHGIGGGGDDVEGVARNVAHLEERSVTTRVRFRPLTPAQIAWYWSSGEPKDKAGGYAIQGLGGAFVEAIEGSHSNVVGLPVPETLEMLARAGVTLPWDETSGESDDPSDRDPPSREQT